MPSRRPTRMFNRILKHLCLVVCMGNAIVAGPALAHPHVWISFASVARMRGTVLEAVQETWTFTNGFPVQLAGDFADMPKSGPVGSRYVAMFRSQAFDSLRGADYFTHLYVAGRPAKLKDARDFNVTVVNGHIVYSFVIPLAEQVDLKQSAVKLGIWDDTFFVDFQAAANTKAAVTFDTGAPGTCTARSAEDRDHAIFGGAIFPLSTTLSC